MSEDDIKFHMRAMCYDDISNIHGDVIAQALWERVGYTGKYVAGFVAIPGWVEKRSGRIIGFKESERADQLLKDILSDAKGYI